MIQREKRERRRSRKRWRRLLAHIDAGMAAMRVKQEARSVRRAKMRRWAPIQVAPGVFRLPPLSRDDMAAIGAELLRQ